MGHRTDCIDWTCAALFSIAQRTTCEALVLQPLGCPQRGTYVLHYRVPVHSGTAPFSADPYTCDMQLESGVASFRRSSDVAVNNLAEPCPRPLRR
jgi:hypothetical protein